MGKKLFVGGLPYETNDLQLRELFGAHGKVVSAKVIIDKLTNRSKGFGFVEMMTDEEAKTAVEKLNNFTVGTRRIIVNEARPMEPRPAGGYPPRSSSPGGPPSGADRKPTFGGGPNFGPDSKAFSDRKRRDWDKKKKGDGDRKDGFDGKRGGKRGKGGGDDFGDDGW
jgi:cold-inducible RNA-binding protein